MNRTMQSAIIKKDLKAITANKRIFSVMLILPFFMAVVLPTIFILLLYFVPDSTKDLKEQMSTYFNEQQGDVNQIVLSLLMNNLMPIFFLMIPVMAASVMAASSFVGEKEKRTLETLLYSPLSLKEIFQAKIWSSFIMSMMVSLISFIAMVLVTQIEIVLTTGSLMLPGINWLVVMVLLSPAIALIGISVIVRISAKAQSVEDAQQRSSLLVLPIVLLIVGQFTGILLVNIWILLGIGILFAVIALLMMNGFFKKLSYESLLK